MQKRIPILLLLLCLILSVQALATEDGAEAFARTKTYDGRFTDVAEGSAFYENVAALYEYGLTVGRTETSYAPKDSLTVGQTVIFAGRVRSLYKSGDPEAGAAAFRQDGMPAAIPHLLYLQSEGVLGDELGGGSLGVPATRAQVAHILANLLPSDFLPPVNEAIVAEAYASGYFIADITADTPYEQDILTLYRCGILQGADARGSFFPDSYITRGAAAAMLTRLMDPSLRLTPAWDLRDAYSAVGTSYGDLVLPGQYIPAPATAEEMDQVVRYMLSRGENSVTLRYESLDETAARAVMELALEAGKHYCEQGYNQISCTYQRSGTMQLTFGISADGNPSAFRASALTAAVAVHDSLWAEGKLSFAMTETEKAKVYFDWICANTAYDHTADDDSVSHLAYGLFRNAIAVCDGYTAAYNLLLRLEGISCAALGNDDHLWTVAVLDGETLHIDVTWGDTESGADERYFAMTSQESYEYHPW